MCESTVYLVHGVQKTLVMAEVDVVLTDGADITCINTIGERKRVDDAEIAEANLARHEIFLRPRT